MATNSKEYMRGYMRKYISEHGQYKKEVKRICIDCNHREVEKGCRLCSECRATRDYISLVIRQHKYNMKKRKYNEKN